MTYKCDVGLACNLCRECLETCSTNALTIVDDKLHHDNEKCTYCEVCMDVCEPQAITIMEQMIL